MDKKRPHTVTNLAFIVLLCHTTIAFVVDSPDIRLSQVTDRQYEGVVQIRVNGSWGLVGNFGIQDDVTAKTICKLLGYGFVGFRVLRFTDIGNMPIRVLNVKCNGQESDISQCQMTTTQPHYWQWAPGVTCFDYNIQDIRMVGGVSPSEGAVEVLMDGRWGALCHTPFPGPYPSAFKVICKNFGYRTYDRTTGGFGSTISSYRHPRLSWVNLEYTHCHGNETALAQCPSDKMIKYQPGCENFLTIKCIE